MSKATQQADFAPDETTLLQNIPLATSLLAVGKLFKIVRLKLTRRQGEQEKNEI
jgi:hypothetical protein